MSMQEIRPGSGRLMPELGANPLQVAFQDYQRMEHELALATQEHAAKTDMVNDLLRENEFLRRNYDKAIAERDRFQALAVNLATRAVGVREAVERLIAEAMAARAAPVAATAEVGRAAETPAGDLEQAVSALLMREPGDILWCPDGIPPAKREITRRTTTIAPNEFR
jgi:hypothetical protein